MPILRTTALLAIWLVAIGGGLFAGLRYETTSGPALAGEGQWPSASRMVLDKQRLTLLLFVHPQCPCTRASLAELAALLARCPDKLAVTVVFIRPPEFPAGWERTDLWESACRLPGVRAIVDEAGEEARRFGARTAGEAFLYDVKGKLLFQGGLTQGRGHEGDNASLDALISIVHHGAAAGVRTRVYGCALFNQ